MSLSFSQHPIQRYIAMKTPIFRSWMGAILLCLACLSQEAVAQPIPLQLDEACTVTIGNQTAPVRPDGSFVVPNISIFRSRDTGIAPQLFRVRATCIRNGQQVSGQSGYFSLVPGNTVFIDKIFPSVIDPIPVSIAASSTKQVLALNETAQIQVIATFADGSTEDVTLRSKGTTYLSSNSNLIKVDASGLVTNVSQARRILTGRIESGQAQFDGKDLLALPDRELNRYRGKDLTMIFQGDKLKHHLSDIVPWKYYSKMTLVE